MELEKGETCGIKHVILTTVYCVSCVKRPHTALFTNTFCYNNGGDGRYLIFHGRNCQRCYWKKLVLCIFYKPQTSSKRDTHRMDDVTSKYIGGMVREFLEFYLDIFATSPSQNCKKKKNSKVYTCTYMYRMFCCICKLHVIVMLFGKVLNFYFGRWE